MECSKRLLTATRPVWRYDHESGLSMHADFAVLGAGAAGMMTALLAARRGMQVVIIDPHFSAPNNLFISGGLFPAAGSRLQGDAGGADTPQAWLEDLHAFAGDSVNSRIAAAVADALPALVDFLIDECAAPIRFLADVPAPGHRVARFHSVEPASGRSLHAWLRQAMANQRSIRCVADRPLQSVDRLGQGFAVNFSHAGGSVQSLQAKFMMLAGGGFGGNANLVAQHIPAMRGALHSGAASNDGSVLTLAAQWGAAFAGMDGYQGQGHTNPGGSTRLGMSLPLLGAVLVNRGGQRFVREDIGPSALAAHVLVQPGQMALEIFDAEVERQLNNHSAYQDARAAGRVLAAASIEELAQLSGVPFAPLDQTLRECARHAGAAAAHDADLLGRAHFARALQPPYRASWVTGALAHTQGGVMTDASARVLSQSGAVIPALYAAGGTAAGLSGHGGAGYLPGNGLAQSFGLAWLAVQSIQAVTAAE